MSKEIRIGLISDLHVKHWSNRLPNAELSIFNRIVESIDEQGGVDILVNCGDTESSSINVALENEMRERAIQYKVISGNHDYYGQTVNVETMSSEVFSSDYLGRSFVYGTLWTNFNDDVMAAIEAQRWINDFRFIKTQNNHFNFKDVANIFENTKKLIESAKRDVVCTHFGCHPLSIHPRYKNDIVNNYFVPNMTNTMKKCEVKLWLHGHVHDQFDYVTDFGTRVVTNPLGYPGESYKKIEDYSVKIVSLT